MKWVIFGKYKWTRACVQLAKDDAKREHKTVEFILFRDYGAYRHYV